MNEITRKTYIILTLASLFFLSGIYFFFFHGRSIGNESDPEAVKKLPTKELSYEDTFILKNMPPPERFQSFVYGVDATFAATGTCSGAYSVVLIYPKTIDYRADPLSAIYNRAEPCSVGQSFERSLEPSSTSLKFGMDYYLIRASQGEKGIWYDPY